MTEQSPEERRAYYKDVRDEARKSMRKVGHAMVLVEKQATSTGNIRERGHWWFVYQLLADRKIMLDSLLKTYRLRKQVKRA